jgi:hypothetical protein
MIRKLKQNSNQSMVSNDSSELDLSIDTESSQNGIQPPIDNLKIPSKTILNNTDLKRLKGFTAVRKKLKHESMKQDFVNQVSGVLDLFETSSNKYEHEIVQFVCSVAEDYFITSGKMGNLKEDAVIACVKQYFNNDIELVKKIIQLVLPNIPKSNFLRRNKNKIYNFFLFVLGKFS